MDFQQESGSVENKREREFVRTDDNIPVYYEVLSDDNPSGFQSDWEILFDEIEPKPEENPKLYELLFDINQKLNILLNHMNGKEGFNIPEAMEVNISGGGLRFYSNECFNSGDRLFLKTFLPTHAHVIRIKCEVVRCVPAGGGRYEVAVKYTDMDETTRDKIIRYIFAKQRRLLRNEKNPVK